MTCLAAAALCLLPVSADRCHFGDPGTTVWIAPHDEAFAVVEIRNELAWRIRDTCALTIWGVTVVVRYDAGPGREIDRFSITVPPGFRADPADLLLHDEHGARVLIWITGENS
jgi:hypothetical protein